MVQRALAYNKGLPSLYNNLLRKVRILKKADIGISAWSEIALDDDIHGAVRTAVVGVFIKVPRLRCDNTWALLPFFH